MKFLFLLALFVVTACAAPVEYEPVVSDDGNGYLVAATRAARTVIAERKTATVDARNLGATETAYFKTETPLAATAAAFDADRTATAARRTAVFLDDEGTRAAHAFETATVIVAGLRAADETATADANATRTADARATSTAVALETDAPLTALAKDYQQREMQNKIVAAEADAIRAQAWGEFFDGLMKFIVACGSIALLVILLFSLSKYLDSLAMQRRVIETRSGTAMITILQGRPTVQLLKPVTNLLDAPHDDYFDLPSDAPTAREIPVRTSSGSTYTVSDADPDETARKLVLRLLSASIHHYRTRGFDPNTITRLSTWRDLEWSADTWARAIDLLRPHLVVKQGRGGGAFCGSVYPNLMALYIAVGERRAALSTGAVSRAA